MQTVKCTVYQALSGEAKQQCLERQFLICQLIIAMTTVGSQFAKFKEAGTSFQHFLSTFINFKPFAWRHMLMFMKSIKKLKYACAMFNWSGVVVPHPPLKQAYAAYGYYIRIRASISLSNLHFELQTTRRSTQSKMTRLDLSIADHP